MNISQLAKFISFLTVLIIIWTEALGANTDYTEFEFGDASTPLVALGQEILNSNDIQKCIPSNTAHINPYAFLRSLGLNPIDHKQKPSSTPSSQNQSFDNLLIGFPIKALSQRMAIGAVITHIVTPPHFTPFLTKQLMHYKLGRHRATELKPKLVASKEGECLLSFDICPYRWNCDLKFHSTFLQIPILGISTKHHALIFDSTQLGKSLRATKKLRNILFLKQSKRPKYGLAIKEDPKTSIIDFTDSSLIFDITSKTDWRFSPDPEITQRWFLKFDLVSSEKGFQSRPPTKGVGYFLNTQEERLLDIVKKIPQRIVRRRIFKNGQIQPTKYYVKNVPKQYQSAFQRAFEYWQSIFTSLISHPILSYEFIQGDFDKDGQEILTGDVRFNVIEWEDGLEDRNNRGSSFSLFNQNTGEIWASYIVIYGAHFIDAYQKRFQYSKMVRESLLSSYQNNPENRLFTQINIFNQLTDLIQVKPYFFLPLTQDNGTFESYTMRATEHSAGHEVGHTLGLIHNYKGSIFANETYAANTKMDLLSNTDRHKKISGDYDQMAIAYGYLGIPPHRTDMFCRDAVNLSLFSLKSPECAERDSSSYPLQHTALELREVVDLLTTKSYIPSRPYLIWNGFIERYIIFHLNTILPYYRAADTYYDKIQSVLIDGRKPQKPQEVKDVVLKILKSFTCDPKLLEVFHRTEEINQNPSNFDQHLQNNVVMFFNLFNTIITMSTDISLSDLHSCS